MLPKDSIPKYQDFHVYFAPTIVLRSKELIPHSSSELLKMFRQSKENSDDFNGSRMIHEDNEGGEGTKKYNLRDRVAVPALYDESQETAIVSSPLELEGMGSEVGEDAIRKGKKRSRTEEEVDDDCDVDSHQNVIIDRGPPPLVSSFGFEDIGGLSECIYTLKEMVLLPLLNPDFCESFGIPPSRGVLLCGPPGTGKTLTARALASEASRLGHTKVSFYMRKGADVLSKWAGESENQLKLLFEEAQKNQPSIIFFDEIDGLAPLRSDRQEQVHNSIVSTLLALMDGLDSRGQVLLLGATNRIDAIDGALRRPGRFDREFNFPLPDSKARAQILDIHTRKWKEPPSEYIRRELAEACVGYCGADLKALCTEAAIRATRGRYPQLFSSSSDGKVSIDAVKVNRCHFLEAMTIITPAAHRGSIVNSRPLSTGVLPCMKRVLKEAMSAISEIFPLRDVDHTTTTKLSYRFCNWPRLLLCGDDDVGLNEHLVPAVLHEVERFPVHSLELLSLLSDPGAKTPEEALVRVVGEARRSTPSVLYLPHFHLWWETAHDQLKASLWMTLKRLPGDLPILLLGTSSMPLSECDDSHLSSIFSHHHVFQLSSPTREDRSLFLDGVIEAAAAAALAFESDNNPMKNSSTPKVADHEAEEHAHALGRLRVCLEDVCNRILNDKQFSAFHRHHRAIEKYPMAKDITTLLQLVKSGKYVTCKSFEEEFNLILAAAKEYGRKRMVISAYELRDYVKDMVSQMEPSLVNFCDKIAEIPTHAAAAEANNDDWDWDWDSKQLLLDHCEKYNIPQLQRLYTTIMKGVSKTKKYNGGSDVKALIKRLFFEFELKEAQST